MPSGIAMNVVPSDHIDTQNIAKAKTAKTVSPAANAVMEQLANNIGTIAMKANKSVCLNTCVAGLSTFISPTSFVIATSSVFLFHRHAQV
jgi:hypothetical protein